MTGTTFVSNALLKAAAGLVVTMLILVGAGAASATPTAAPPAHGNQLSSTLGELWTTVLQSPGTGPFGGGSPCVYLPDGQLAPFGPGSCTVQRGTKIFVWPWTTECSTFVGDCGGPTDSYSQLLAAAEAFDAGFTTHTLTVDGKTVPMTEVVTAPLHVVLPDNNVFGEPGGTSGLSAAHGWVALLDALPVGAHTIVIRLVGNGYTGTPLTTTINVVP